MKKLITANDIRDAHAAGKTRLEVVLKDSIITPEAHVVADQLGFAICEVTTAQNTAPTAAPVAATAGTEPNISSAERQKIRECIIAQLPAGNVTETLIAQLVDKVVQERMAQIKAKVAAFKPAADENTDTPNTQSYRSVTGKGGIKVVDSSSVKFGNFDGAGPHRVGIADLITAQDNSSMAAGFMQWDKGFFPWTLNYDEVDLVLEGELHVRHEGETMIAKAGDVMFIPKGSAIEFGTTSTVRFLYVAWPANWQEC
ncbi:ethanolamine utilization acetate kinase EutQ [Morganella psychrotolerans]|uniref:Ethanolamine utilization acetate kinase EutQ n=1 Tax=Morganella psychrotolerans TaxID=368603 RepID=A0A5M9R3W5_9GAMM|nr:ethanolamine utilization acetate kinase EutQ [Morganella psychrotolerans]KAA8714862.1 ethanolamine utilization acetate kinase EutQ [Morganella psychrotolerans]OBU04591.1 ethanolamine utilization protein EutQ [Morganella psychrotolerans]